MALHGETHMSLHGGILSGPACERHSVDSPCRATRGSPWRATDVSPCRATHGSTWSQSCLSMRATDVAPWRTMMALMERPSVALHGGTQCLSMEGHSWLCMERHSVVSPWRDHEWTSMEGHQCPSMERH